MIEARHPYTSKDFAFIIPTKDRPGKLNKLLESLANQSESCGRVLIIASGQNVEYIAKEFLNHLPIEYYHSETYGQIHQRNLGINLLDNRTKLVGTLDDDIVLQPEALKKIIKY